MNTPYTNTGHGYAWERPDGVKMKCGGIGICEECSVDEYNMFKDSEDPIRRTLKDQYEICKERGHVKDEVVASILGMFSESKWYRCKFCHTNFTTKVTTEQIERNQP